MDILKNCVDVLLHFDQYLNVLIQDYGMLTYVILFFIVFAETGLVVFPFLPGDSLLFAAGAFAALESLDIKLVFITFCVAAVLGDTLNYAIGKFIGQTIYESANLRFIKKEHLFKTHQFYEKHGPITIIIARFIPVVRTFAPFVAGVGEMHYIKFLSYNEIGGLLWVFLFTLGGYYFGNLPIVKQNFSLFIVAVVFISILPLIIGFFKQKRSSQQRP